MAARLYVSVPAGKAQRALSFDTHFLSGVLGRNRAQDAFAPPYSPNILEGSSPKLVCSIMKRIFYVARKAARYPRVPSSVRSWSSPPASVSLRSSSKVTL